MYDIFFITQTSTNNEDYLNLKQKFPTIKIVKSFTEAKKKSLTRFFWLVPDDVAVSAEFNFSYTVDEWSHEYIHVFKNSESWDGIALFPKKSDPTNIEIETKNYINVKHVDIIASIPKPYDIVFISYQEPNADKNYENLKEKYPRAKRIHGVTGIHQAHIEAAKLADTEMVWIVDGDAVIVDEFNFDYHASNWDKNTVHVWRSVNPVNDLVYGYGGVKLFPRELTINMDLSKPDMTTSISNKFKAIQQISNITEFNTDPFNTWKSAFRECCKLSSKIIDRQKDDETNQRLKIWCTIGEDKLFGKYALDGAKCGTTYGMKYRNKLENLKKINDFSWLKEQFDARNI